MSTHVPIAEVSSSPMGCFIDDQTPGIYKYNSVGRLVDCTALGIRCVCFDPAHGILRHRPARTCDEEWEIMKVYDDQSTCANLETFEGWDCAGCCCPAAGSGSGGGGGGGVPADRA